MGVKPDELFVPKLWSEEIMRTFAERIMEFPRMIDKDKLEGLIRNSTGVEGIEDLNAALVELRWRRQQMGKLQRGRRSTSEWEQKVPMTLGERVKRSLKFW